ncbi:MAG: hypothetical protein U0L08_02475, partial [Bacteroidales bacterium]|nr:hypothetical protein [Bacteroidales bacterium]
LFNNYSLKWVEEHREEFLKKAPTYKDFSKEYEKLNLLKDFEKYAEQEGVKRTEVKKEWVNKIILDYLQKETSDSLSESYDSYVDYAKMLTSEDKLLKEVISKAEQEDEKAKQINKDSEKYIASTLKALIARNLYGVKYYYMTVFENDKELKEAIDVLKDKKRYTEILKNK